MLVVLLQVQTTARMVLILHFLGLRLLWAVGLVTGRKLRVQVPAVAAVLAVAVPVTQQLPVALAALERLGKATPVVQAVILVVLLNITALLEAAHLLLGRVLLTVLAVQQVVLAVVAQRLVLAELLLPTLAAVAAV